jgi:hypothetical protein
MIREWPPTPYPPREPNPNGDDLLDPVDWMTFSHRELHLMATTRLHPETARELSGEWLRTARKLDEIADKLIRLNQLTGGAWEGAAAELARHTGRQLSTWADETGNGARGVADYLDRHASNAEWASRAMPEPDHARGFDLLPNWRRDDPDADGPDAYPAGPRHAVDGGGTTPSAAGGIDFEAARFLVEDEGEARERRQHKHRRAAEVMTRMQANAVEIFGTIPRFTKPAVSARQDVDQVSDHTAGATSAAGYSGSSGGGTAGGGPETQAPGARSMGNGQVSGLPSGGMTSGNSGHGGPGGGRVAFGVAPLGGPTAAAAGRGVAGAMGVADRRGGPIGLISPGAGRRAGDDEAEHRSRGLLSGDAAIFDPDEDPAPEIVAADGYDEPPRSPGYEPPPPISLDRLPGNWVRRGA